MNILSIGNSFSCDATRYLHEIAKSEGENITSVNLYIGGCSLSRHFRNMMADAKNYSLEFNGQSTGFFISIKEALLSRDWDYITLQQVSSQSVDFNTFTPYLEELSAYVKKLAPKAKQVIHQTWGYEDGSARLTNEMGYKTHAEMFEDIKKAYIYAEKEIGADFTIPSGELICTLYKKGLKNLQRDTFHASFGLGRYALALLWYGIFTKKDVKDVGFKNFDEPVSENDILLIKATVSEILRKE